MSSAVFKHTLHSSDDISGVSSGLGSVGLLVLGEQVLDPLEAVREGEASGDGLGETG